MEHSRTWLTRPDLLDPLSSQPDQCLEGTQLLEDNPAHASRDLRTCLVSAANACSTCSACSPSPVMRSRACPAKSIACRVSNQNGGQLKTEFAAGSGMQAFMVSIQPRGWMLTRCACGAEAVSVTTYLRNATKIARLHGTLESQNSFMYPEAGCRGFRYLLEVLDAALGGACKGEHLVRFL